MPVEGSMPSSWSRASVPFGRNWRIRRVSCSGVGLRRSEKATSKSRAGISANKANWVVCDLLFGAAAELLLLLLAGHGGEGKEKDSLLLHGFGGGGGCSPARVLWRCSWQSLKRRSVASPWKRRTDFAVEVKPHNNLRCCRRCSTGGTRGSASLLAGRGGEEERGGCRVAAGLEQRLLLHQPGVPHMADMDVSMICGKEGHQCRCFDGESTTSKMEALVGVSGRRYTPPNQQVVRPRWLVAGGRMRKLGDDDHGGEDPGLDCFSEIPAGSFLLNARTALDVSILHGPLCILYPPFGY